MTTSEPKNILIHNIAAIDDESFLQAIKTIIDIKTQTTVYKTTNQHKALVEERIEQIEKGDYFSNEKVAEEIEKWLQEK
ncbi:MAG: hypothetical protein KDC05_14155 [Bacteroidales bacterium]|nr:hypothetical protein [Bacteroidales bacterium]